MYKKTRRYNIPFLISLVGFFSCFSNSLAQTTVELNYGLATNKRVLSAYGNSISSSTFQSPGIGLIHQFNNWLFIGLAAHYQQYNTTLTSGFIDSTGAPQVLISTGKIQRFSFLGGPQIRFYQNGSWSFYTGFHLGYTFYQKEFTPEVNFNAFNDKLNAAWFVGAMPIKVNYKIHQHLSIGAALNIGAPYFFVSRIALHLNRK